MEKISFEKSFPFCYNKLMVNSDELLFSVDENNNPINPQPRALSHQTGIWHRSCHVWIINHKREILCQQRSLLKDSNPGRWEPFFGGHLAPSQKYIVSAISELEEELGLSIDPGQLRFFKEYKYSKGTEFQGIFILEWNDDLSTLKLEEDEVQRIEWKGIDEVEQLVVHDKSEQWTFIGYENELLDWLRK
jgi:isopentenyldiphosphate isomerase